MVACAWKVISTRSLTGLCGKASYLIKCFVYQLLGLDIIYGRIIGDMLAWLVAFSVKICTCIAIIRVQSVDRRRSQWNVYAGTLPLASNLFDINQS